MDSESMRRVKSRALEVGVTVGKRRRCQFRERVESHKHEREGSGIFRESVEKRTDQVRSGESRVEFALLEDVTEKWCYK